MLEAAGIVISCIMSSTYHASIHAMVGTHKTDLTTFAQQASRISGTVNSI